MTDLPYPDPPAQPPETAWPFERELRQPVHTPVRFGAGHPPGARDLDFRQGFRLNAGFPDPDGRLKTAIADFRSFLKSIGLARPGSCPLVLAPARTPCFEAYALAVRRDGIVISAGDTEGIRRGLVELEDRILARDHAALPCGMTRRRPVIRTRLSRCFYGPINRPPKCRDELADRVNYYPDGYLNRLAHHGINALWLTIRFRDLCASSVLPELGPASPRRLEKLRRTIRQCARYGIKLYPFCIEPAALPLDSPVFRAHPELKGAPIMGGRACFCTSSQTGCAYLEEAARTVFAQAPGLGGLVCIPVGERFTHCYSCRFPTSCPRCARRAPWAVLSDTLAALERGMRAAAPGAELIAWPYGQLGDWGPARTVKAAGRLPPHVILQHNFETGGRVRQLGAWRTLSDYWLSWAGPSRVFADCARAARARGTRVFAKLQTSCSHEVATTQVVPVPGILYRKYKRMHALGVSGVMQGWYFGNYPSLMTRASLRLAFAPFPKSESAFLRELAARNWGRHAPQAARAWRRFREGYARYPGTHLFGYYGPMHDGVVWPLHLEPRHRPLAPTWRIVHPPSGDQAGECFAPTFTHAEALRLCAALRDRWRRGTDILRRIERAGPLGAECRQEINVARALGIQFDSGANILLFYRLRDALATAATARRQRALLGRLRRIVRAELANNRALLRLCAENKTLGFHSEAEGYKYFPAKIRWRMRQLRRLLAREFPRVARQVGQRPLPAFENYIGRGPSIRAYPCAAVRCGATLAAQPFDSRWAAFPLAVCRFWAGTRAADAARPFPFNATLHPVPPNRAPPPALAWRAVRGGAALYFCLEWKAGAAPGGTERPEPDEIRLAFEPLRLGPAIAFVVGGRGAGAGMNPLETREESRGDTTRLTAVVPFRRLGPASRPRGRAAALRVHVSRFFSPITDPLCFTGSPRLNSWAPVRLTLPRNVFGYSDPGAYGWLTFGPAARRPRSVKE